MLAANPELVRNLWLQFSLWRFIGAPVIFLLLLSVGVGQWFLLFVAFCIGVLWGARPAAGAILDEIRERTWDGQRMSALSAWSVAWGKLLGSVSYIWYCLLVLGVMSMAWADLEMDPRRYLNILWASAFAQGTAFFCGVLVAGARRPTKRSVTGIHLAGILSGLFCYGYIRSTFDFGAKAIDFPFSEYYGSWYGMDLPAWPFALVSVSAFGAWWVFGAYRLLRLQLGYRNLPWGYCAFNLFLGIYVTGLFFSEDYRSLFPDIFSLFGLGLAYVVLSWDEMNRVRCLRCANAWQRGGFGELLTELPLSITALIWLLPWALVVTLTADVSASSETFSWEAFDGFLELPGFLPDAMFPWFLFLLRDTGLFWALCLGNRHGRGKWRAFFLVGVLHLLLPWISIGLEWEHVGWWLSCFNPMTEEFHYLPVLVEILLVALWVQFAWRRSELQRGAGHTGSGA